jgi:hypothetical protein
MNNHFYGINSMNSLERFLECRMKEIDLWDMWYMKKYGHTVTPTVKKGSMTVLSRDTDLPYKEASSIPPPSATPTPSATAPPSATPSPSATSSASAASPPPAVAPPPVSASPPKGTSQKRKKKDDEDEQDEMDKLIKSVQEDEGLFSRLKAPSLYIRTFSQQLATDIPSFITPAIGATVGAVSSVPLLGEKALFTGTDPDELRRLYSYVYAVNMQALAREELVRKLANKMLQLYFAYKNRNK